MILLGCCIWHGKCKGKSKTTKYRTFDMKTLNTKHFAKAALALAIGFTGLSQAQAQTANDFEFSGTVIGNFADLDTAGQSRPNVTIGNNDAGGIASINWGTPARGYTDNFFTFDGAGSDAGDSSFTIRPDQSFAIGTFSYQNGATYSGTNINGVDLDISVDIEAPGAYSTDFSYSYDITSTPNVTGNNVLDADFVTVNANNNSIGTVSFANGAIYELEISGFSTDGGRTVVESFHVAENATASAELHAQFKTVAAPAPGVGAGALGALALSALGFTRRRKAKTTEAA